MPQILVEMSPELMVRNDAYSIAVHSDFARALLPKMKGMLGSDA